MAGVIDRNQFANQLNQPCQGVILLVADDIQKAVHQLNSAIVFILIRDRAQMGDAIKCRLSL